ncbi:hypothetical protein ME121_6179 [Methylobacterium sp. ME121]|nr:hypothetical protein ME121_6179 [Methylobacterium sp. ME121]
MARITLYVPDALHRRLREHAADLNFSAIAQQAFREHLSSGCAPKSACAGAEHLPTSLPDAPGVWWNNGGLLCRTPDA